MSYITDFENELPSLLPLWNVWDMDKQIGESARGRVYRLKRTEIDNTEYQSALKVICLPASETESQHIYAMKNDPREAQMFVRDMVQETAGEVKIMYALKGLTNIVNYEDHWIIPTENSNRYYVLIRMELVTSLTSILSKPERYPIKEKDVIQLGIDICSALEICQRNQVVHRDIKPDNLFLSSHGNFKLGDFGISRIFDHTMMASTKGTIPYMAPEIYRNKEYNNKADIYSLGIVMYQLLNDNGLPLLAPNFRHSDIDKANRSRLNGAKLPLPRNACNELGQLVLRACAYEAEDRFDSPAEMQKSLENLRDNMKDNAGTLIRINDVKSNIIPIKDGRTSAILDGLQRCEDIEDLKSIIDDNSDNYINWKEHINNLVKSYSSSRSEFAKRCGINYKTIVSWCEKGVLPNSRYRYIQLGFGLKMSLEEVNDFLQRYGKYPMLYSKNIEDAIFIFALNHDLSYQTAKKIQDQIIPISKAWSPKLEEKPLTNRYFETTVLQNQLLSLPDAEQLERFVMENSSVFLRSYEKLISFLDDYIKINSMDYTGTEPQESANSFLNTKIDNPKLVNRYNMFIANLRHREVIPRRYDLLALGIYLDMSLDHVNEMLTMAGMEHLCAKDKLESVLIYAIENAILENPDIEYSNAILLMNNTDNNELKASCSKIIERYKMNPYKSAERDGGILAYVHNALKQIELPDISEFSRLLESKERLKLADNNDRGQIVVAV